DQVARLETGGAAAAELLEQGLLGAVAQWGHNSRHGDLLLGAIVSTNSKVGGPLLAAQPAPPPEVTTRPRIAHGDLGAVFGTFAGRTPLVAGTWCQTPSGAAPRQPRFVAHLDRRRQVRGPGRSGPAAGGAPAPAFTTTTRSPDDPAASAGAAALVLGLHIAEA